MFRFLFRSPIFLTQYPPWSWHNWTESILPLTLSFLSFPQCLWPGQNYQQRSLTTPSPPSLLTTSSLGKAWRWLSLSEASIYSKPMLEMSGWTFPVWQHNQHGKHVLSITRRLLYEKSFCVEKAFLRHENALMSQKAKPQIHDLRYVTFQKVTCTCLLPWPWQEPR